MLLVGEQRVAEVEGLAQSPPLRARGGVRRGAEHVERMLEPGEESACAQDIESVRRQLERERQPVEPDADLLDNGPRLLVQLEAGHSRAGALDEQLDRLNQRQRPDREAALAPCPCRRVRRREHREVRNGRDEPVELHSRLCDPVDVVDDEQRRAAVEHAQ